MKKLGLYIVFLSLFFAGTSSYNEVHLTIQPTSELYIQGTTNINSFQCDFDVEKINNPINLRFKKTPDKIKLENAVLKLPINHFDCGGRIINKDFRKFVKAEKYPEILLSVDYIKTNPETLSMVYASVDITIANITKNYQIPAAIDHFGSLEFKGELILNVKDFGLEPPRKALGMIVVSEEIKIIVMLDVD